MHELYMQANHLYIFISRYIKNILMNAIANLAMSAFSGKLI